MSDFPDSIRMSHLRMYTQCPKKFELMVLDGEKGEPAGERLRVGTALDRTIRHWANYRKAGETLDLSDGQMILADQWVKAGQEQDYAPATLETDHIMDAALRVVETVGQIIAKVNPVMVDEKLSRSVTTRSGATLDVTGTIDLTYKHQIRPSKDESPGAHHLRDVKMSGKAASSWSPANAAQDFQLTTYTWLADATKTPVDTQGWIVGRALKRDTQVLHEAVDVTDAAVELTGQRLAMIASAVESSCETGVFLPTAAITQDWSCSAAYCPLFARVCAYGARARTAVLIEGEAA